jgi:hypothetical protein
MAIEKPSTTSVAADAPIALYSNSPEVTDLGPNYRRLIPGNTIGARYLGSADIGYSEIDETLYQAEDAAAEEEAAEEASDVKVLSSPSLSDIQVVSKNVVYDASGNPSVEIVFKIKNSSGQELKGINTRVELK